MKPDEKADCDEGVMTLFESAKAPGAVEKGSTTAVAATVDVPFDDDDADDAGLIPPNGLARTGRWSR